MSLQALKISQWYILKNIKINFIVKSCYTIPQKLAGKFLNKPFVVCWFLLRPSWMLLLGS